MADDDDEVPATQIPSQGSTIVVRAGADSQSQNASQLFTSPVLLASVAGAESQSQNVSQAFDSPVLTDSQIHQIYYATTIDGSEEKITMWVTQEGEMSQSPNVHLDRVEYANGTEGMGLRLRRGCKRGDSMLLDPDLRGLHVGHSSMLQPSMSRNINGW